jgi:maleylacetoacetate isomerase
VIKLYGYWRSSAAYRVRIALNLKGLAYEQVAIDLRKGEQRTADYRRRNPQALVPALENDGRLISQSLAIIEHLDERYPDPPLLPRDPFARARARELALIVACEIHPLNNLRVLDHLRGPIGLDDAAVQRWYEHWIAAGLAMLEAELARGKDPFCVGDQPSIADLCLVPQLYNGRRYNCDLEPYHRAREIEARCLALPAFLNARPEAQPDAVSPA